MEKLSRMFIKQLRGVGAGGPHFYYLTISNMRLQFLATSTTSINSAVQQVRYSTVYLLLQLAARQ